MNMHAPLSARPLQRTLKMQKEVGEKESVPDGTA